MKSSNGNGNDELANSGVSAAQARKKWAVSASREHSITKFDSAPPADLNNSLTSLSNASVIAEEIRQKRESFLRKLEENENIKSDAGSINQEIASAASSKAASRRPSATPVNGELKKLQETAIVSRRSSGGSVPAASRRRLSNSVDESQVRIE